jgi:crotonobetainyl-CoA:carnitine CoA-transferase CaiB-like acyl-CoA transferase
VVSITSGPLAGVKVLDVSILAAGPWVGALLGELGAEVIKVEPPVGDGTRWVQPLQHGMGTNYICMNVNKRGVILDLKDPRGHATAVELVADCDVFVQNFRAGVMDRLGLGYEAVRSVNPRIVYASVSGFGSVGPLAREQCVDFIMQAFSGFARLNGQPGSAVEQFRFSGFIDLSTASVATEAILAALLDREATGIGQHVDVSMLEAALEMQHTRFAEYLITSEQWRPRGSESPSLVPDRAFAALDREVFVTVHDEVEWSGFCAAVGRPELIKDERFSDNRRRVANREELYAEVAPLFSQRAAIWWLRAMDRHRVPAGIAWDFETFRRHVQVVENGMIAEFDTPWGHAAVGGIPWHFSRTECAVTPPPVPGHDTEAILSRSRSTGPGHGSDLRRQQVDGPHGTIFDGIKVVELASGVAGPLASLRLSDLGADVIKIERSPGDWLRAAAPIAPGSGDSAPFVSLNRGKRSVGVGDHLNAAAPLLSRLVATADVVICDWDRADMEVAGVASLLAEASKGRSRQVWILLNDFGHMGPLASRRGSELIVQAHAGYTRYLGERGRPAIRLGSDVAGAATAIFAVQAVLAALRELRRSGAGQLVTLSRLNSLLTMKSVQIAAQTDPDDYLGPRVSGAHYPVETGWQARDEPFTFAFGGFSGNQGRPGWTDFVDEIGLGWMREDDRFKDDPTGRETTGFGSRVHALRGEYESGFIRHDASEIVAAVRRHGGTASEYQEYSDVVSHPQTRALGVVRDASDVGSGVRVSAFPARFSTLKTRVLGGAPSFGSSTNAIVADLGFTTEQLDEMIREGGISSQVGVSENRGKGSESVSRQVPAAADSPAVGSGS